MSRVANTNNNNNMIDQVDTFGMSTLALDSFSFSDTLMKPINASMSDDTSSTCTSSCMSSFSSSTNLSGWGSAISRKSYACLRTLEEESRMQPYKTAAARQQQQSKQVRRQVEERSYVGESWGYFVDTPDC